ncbi:MAG: hypothetical protein ACF8NJ_01420 [Phycisphaerales bacterium JB038]
MKVERNAPAPHRRWHLAARLALTLAAATLLIGCNIVAPAIGVASGRGKQEAMYTLKPKLSTLVFVDDRASKLGRSSLRLSISEVAGRALLQNELVEDVINSQGAIAFARTELPDKPFTIEEIGESVGAAQIIYVEIDGFGLTNDGVTLAPTASARARVVEVGATPARVWPEGADAFQVYAQVRDQGEVQLTNASRRALQDKLAAELGAAIAKLFYEHTNPYLLEREGR